MKKIYFSILIIIVSFHFILTKEQAKYVNDEFVLETKISINIPNTRYVEVNEMINKKITKIKKDFEKNITNNNFTFVIDYKEYKYYNYISYAFFIETYLGGAHPSHDLFTIVYDTEDNKIIDINTLITYNSKTLKVFSAYSRANLIYNSKIDIHMLLEGTTAKIDNFTNFVFDKNIILFFKEYQIAPYSSGIITLDVPYYMIK